MEESATDNRGYVYILEVKDIDLPVCKIGMTTRTPHDRCNEINNSSTGDFIWSVAHYIAVDNCKN
ncbi:GIY-YIG nuclease family protein [Aeromonas rivipollensis]